MGHGLSKFTDDIYHGLPAPSIKGSLNDLLFDEHSSPKKYTKTMSLSVTAEMYQAMQELVQHPDLPFEGNMSNAGRHAIAGFIEANEQFLAEDGRTIFRSLMRQQRRLTRERIIITIEDIIGQQVDAWQVWSAHGKWAEVLRQFRMFLAEVQDYPVQEWQEHVARVFLRHDGMKALLKSWAVRMKEDSTASWSEVQRLYHKLEEMAGE